MNEVTLGWLAGLLEGEGCFHLERGYYARISLQMADGDVVRRLQEATGKGRVTGPWWPSKTTYEHNRPMWRWVVNTQADVKELITAVYPLMGERRQAKIRLCLETMENHVPNPSGRPRSTVCPRGHPMIEGDPNVMIVGSQKKRRCRACQDIRTEKYRAQRAASRHLDPAQA